MQEYFFMAKTDNFLKVKDHSVSGEEFVLVRHPELDLLETTPKPSLERLPEYYKSEDYISHTDAKRNVFEKVYHVVRNISLQRKLKLINAVSSESKSLLDIGCGTGDFLKVAQDANWNVFGIEPNEEARSIANKKTKNNVFDVSKFPTLKDQSFDVITLWHVLEHLPDLKKEIEQLKRLLRPNGTLIIAVPNFKSYDANYYKSYWAAFDVPRHLWHFSKTAISELFMEQDMVVGNILPMPFDAFYVSLLSEKYKNGKMNFLKAFWVGIQSNLKAKRSGEYSSLIYVLKNK